MTSTRVIGRYTVPAIGLGCMPLSGMPPSKQWILNERDTALGIVHAALDAGVRLLDTADIYAPIGGIDIKDSLENGSYDAKARSI
jgi:aryl-alcohol dehydrogenase-like predicted oxidoreductase